MAFPGTYNFNYYCGDTYEFTISPKNSSGTAFDLTGYTAIFSIATERGNANSIVLTSTDPEQLVADISESTITCKILPSAGADLSGTYVYDIEITQTSTGNVYTVLTGTITVTQDVQRT